MAEIEKMWCRIGAQVIDLLMVEHFVLTKAYIPPEGANWRSATKAMITFDVENRHYVFSFDSDEEAKIAFDDLWDTLMRGAS